MVEELVAKAKQGDQQAFDALYNKHKKIVFSVCYNILGNRYPNDIDDVANITFAKAFGNINTFKSESAFTTWLYAIAKNEALMVIRNAVKPGKYYVAQGIEDIEYEENKYTYILSFNDKNYNKVENRQVLDKILDNVPDKFRVYLFLHYIEGYTLKEICTITNKSLTAVKSWIHRSVKQAKEFI